LRGFCSFARVCIMGDETYTKADFRQMPGLEL
jgi:hypothetical protein